MSLREVGLQLGFRTDPRLAPMLLKNKAVQSVFDKFELTDDFGASPEYDKLYTELTGTIVLLIEVNGLPTIGGENMT